MENMEAKSSEYFKILQGGNLKDSDNVSTVKIRVYEYTIEFFKYFKSFLFCALIVLI